MDDSLLEWLTEVRPDPVRFVQGAFEWGEGDLEDAEIEDWQMELLCQVRDGLSVDRALKIARASGHGIGKSALVSWLILWAFTTFPDTRGVITANTEPQLKTKTWSELGRWFNRFIGNEYFQLTATALLSRDKARERTWRIDMIPWSEKNPEAFAGLHNKGKRLLLIFDEASAIDDMIWDTAKGALTDANTEILWFVFGNPTRNTGRFKQCFDTTGWGASWLCRQIDSRSVKITNKNEIDDWISIYGEDHDEIRIRVKGDFPRVGAMEFISASAIDAAMAREPSSTFRDPLAVGVDVARYGANSSVIFFRRGRDAVTLPRKLYAGMDTVNLSLRINDVFHEHSPDGIFIDGGGLGGGVVDNCRAAGLYVYDVQFGGRDDVGGQATGNIGERYANKRAAMYGALRTWINTGCLPKDETLKRQLLSIRYSLNKKGEILLESKEEMARRKEPSPDDVDALALTFAYPIQPKEFDSAPGLQPAHWDYNPYGEERMSA